MGTFVPMHTCVSCMGRVKIDASGFVEFADIHSSEFFSIRLV